jgi:hypothetical protein
MSSLMSVPSRSRFGAFFWAADGSDARRLFTPPGNGSASLAAGLAIRPGGYWTGSLAARARW